jgi:hypothetical protein
MVWTKVMNRIKQKRAGPTGLQPIFGEKQSGFLHKGRNGFRDSPCYPDFIRTDQAIAYPKVDLIEHMVKKLGRTTLCRDGMKEVCEEG